jgi:hypothetical protein
VELVVDLDKVTVVLAGADDAEQLAVRVAVPADASPDSHATVHRLGDVLEATYVGRLADPTLAYVRPDAIVFHAAGQVGDDWELRFADRCTSLAGEGQTDADGWLPAPVAWPTGRVDPVPG